MMNRHMQDYQKATGAIYGNLFAGYDEKRFEESLELFYMRHRRWGIDLGWFKDKACLDAGCGGGRFVVALARLGARDVQGIDISAEAVAVANKRIQDRKLSNAQARAGSVLELPFPDASFDYVVCSGVLHHTHDPYAGFKELVRVLKPEGKLFLSVYGRGGLRWFFRVDVWRYTICKLIPFGAMERLFRMVGVTPNKRYALLDNLYVPYCYRYTEKETRQWLDSAGFKNIKRVKFERDDYEKPLSKIIYGAGWIQMYADKT